MWLSSNKDSAKLHFVSIGLVDANDTNDFERKLSEVKEPWNVKEKKYIPKGCPPVFFDYIVGKVWTS